MIDWVEAQVSDHHRHGISRGGLPPIPEYLNFSVPQISKATSVRGLMAESRETQALLGLPFLLSDVSQATRYRRARAGNVPRLDTRQARPQAGVRRRCCIPLPSHG